MAEKQRTVKVLPFYGLGLIPVFVAHSANADRRLFRILNRMRHAGKSGLTPFPLKRIGRSGKWTIHPFLAEFFWIPKTVD
jgi:hypothetical protein